MSGDEVRNGNGVPVGYLYSALPVNASVLLSDFGVSRAGILVYLFLNGRRSGFITGCVTLQIYRSEMIVQLGLSDWQIRHALKELKRAGLAFRHTHGFKDGARWSVYRLPVFIAGKDAMGKREWKTVQFTQNGANRTNTPDEVDPIGANRTKTDDGMVQNAPMGGANRTNLESGTVQNAPKDDFSESLESGDSPAPSDSGDQAHNCSFNCSVDSSVIGKAEELREIWNRRLSNRFKDVTVEPFVNALRRIMDADKGWGVSLDDASKALDQLVRRHSLMTNQNDRVEVPTWFTHTTYGREHLIEIFEGPSSRPPDTSALDVLKSHMKDSVPIAEVTTLDSVMAEVQRRMKDGVVLPQHQKRRSRRGQQQD